MNQERKAVKRFLPLYFPICILQRYKEYFIKPIKFLRNGKVFGLLESGFSFDPYRMEKRNKTIKKRKVTESGTLILSGMEKKEFLNMVFCTIGIFYSVFIYVLIFG